MFLGFDSDTIFILDSIRYNNNKAYYISIKDRYTNKITMPLNSLNNELLCILTEIDDIFNFPMRNCVSTPFADARFNKARPLKDYIYLRYRVNPKMNNNVLGFFFDASPERYRFGLRIYKANLCGLKRVSENLFFDNDIVVNKFKKDYRIVMGGLQGFEELFYKEKFVSNIWTNTKEFAIYKEFQQNEIFLSRELLNSISSCFIELKPIYYILKNCITNGGIDRYNEDFSRKYFF